MKEWPEVVALVITYRRKELALREIASIKEYLDYPNLSWHIADDGSGYDYVAALCQEIGPDYVVSHTDTHGKGVGANMNTGMDAVLQRADLWLHLEDDWILRSPMDLKPCVQALVEHEDIGMIRLGRLTAGIEGETFPMADRMWWRMKKGSDTYVFTGNAALRHRRFFDAYGSYKEGLTPGSTELTMCDRFTKKPGPDIVWPAWLNIDEMFFHIGDSQSFKYYMENEGLTAEEAANLWEGITSE